ncbi:hypothetical protein FJTKL_04518 [Diaporthe vaccinii]|uniref:HMG box domain-containing protein n=1 Tax=Diaporthe vaccinii TaxID=105482 RepID=A0ABR4DSY3_9PEZI
MANLKPKMTAVHDGQGRMALYVDESVGQDAIVSRFAPRYQRIVIRGEPCTIFFDKNARSFYIGPVFYKQELMDRPGRYEHITDLNWLPPAGAAGPAGASSPGGSTNPAASGGSTGAAGPAGASSPGGSTNPAASGGSTGAAGPAGASSSGGSTNPAASGGSTDKISRPPTSWTVFMQTKWHEMREENPNISFGEVSKEAARQWKAASDEEKSFYQRLAKHVADMNL